MDPLNLAQATVVAAQAKKATRFVLQDLRGKSDLCNYQMICSGSNEKQVQAISLGIEDHLKKAGHRALAVEGRQAGVWILIDFGSVLCHIFQENVRDHYALESLFKDAQFLDIPGTQTSAEIKKA